jgi:FkbM family methyltransferase
MGAKDKVRKLLNFLHLDVTKNLKYDRLTQKVIQDQLDLKANCVDVGCHKGEILRSILDIAPEGDHFGFEPIPSFYNDLIKNFKGRAQIYPYALSNKEGITDFHYVKNAPAYSGINQRTYKVKSPEIEKIEVEKRTLDAIIPPETKISFVKIDVEGGEFDVLLGAERILKEDHPLLIFEFGNGASEFYEAKPQEFYEYLKRFGYEVYTLDKFVNKQKSLSRGEFETTYREGSDYYFVAK